MGLLTPALGMPTYIANNWSSLAEFMYDTTFRISRELIVPEDESIDPKNFLSEFRRNMHNLRAKPMERHDRKNVFLY